MSRSGVTIDRDSRHTHTHNIGIREFRALLPGYKARLYDLASFVSMTELYDSVLLTELKDFKYVTSYKPMRRRIFLCILELSHKCRERALEVHTQKLGVQWKDLPPP